MTRAALTGVACVTGLVLLALGASYLALERDAAPARRTSPATRPSSAPAAEPHPSFLSGKVTTVGGAIHAGRLRWGGSQEAFWGDYFNGRKHANPWAAHARIEPRPIEIFGIALPRRILGIEIGERPMGRLFMARFGDIARVDAHGRDVRVTLKSGTAFDLDRFEAGDFDDGVRVWDAGGRSVDLDSLQIRAIEFLPGAQAGAAPSRLHGTVRTRQGAFTGFVQWNRNDGVGSDEIGGRTAEGETRLPFDAIRSIARRTPDSSLVTLVDGREVALSGTPDVGEGNRGMYVDDRRYGRVLVSWDAFERVDFVPGGSGPAYGDFPPGHALTGSVTTRAGRRLTGRLVYDLDESETTETLDAPAHGVDYTIPFGLIARVVAAGRDGHDAQFVRLVLHDGEELHLERRGDLGEGNTGLLVFLEGQPPEYVPWEEVEQVDFDRPPAMYPPLGGRTITGAPSDAGERPVARGRMPAARSSVRGVGLGGRPRFSAASGA